MMVTQDDALFDRLMKLRTHGSRKTYYHEMVGYNSRLDTLQAAVLQAKLPHLEGWSAARRANAAFYDAAFADVPELVTPYIDPANTSIYNQYTLRVTKREALQSHLKALGIGNAVYYPLSLHLQACFAYLGYTEGQFPEAEQASTAVLSLPVFPELTPAQRDDVVAAVRGFYGR
jgi:dTDP-4-amino-4,6-dideoxygalactose transaminase